MLAMLSNISHKSFFPSPAEKTANQVARGKTLFLKYRMYVTCKLPVVYVFFLGFSAATDIKFSILPSA